MTIITNIAIIIIMIIITITFTTTVTPCAEGGSRGEAVVIELVH